MRLKSARRVPRQGLVRNETSVTDTPAAKKTDTGFRHITSNVSTKSSLVRHEKMEGRDYVVVPMVMMTEGVHCGSQGPLLYPGDELAKTPAVWNCKPIVVYHPEINGMGVSACDPDIIDKQRIGQIMNTRFDDLGRLTAEAWLEEDRVKKVDNRVWNAIEKEQMVELSTGLFTENEYEDGEWEGEKYKAIARNYRPDHLAVLPDKKGACSIEDGAGFIRNEVSNLSGLSTKTRIRVHNVLMDVLKTASKKNKELQEVVGNELSHDNIREQLSGLVRKANGGSNPEKETWVWICSVYDNYFVFEKEGRLFSQNYAIKDEKVYLEGKTTEVVRVTEYKPVSSSFTGNDTKVNNSKEKQGMDKNAIINSLIANHGYSEEDRAQLLALNEKTLKHMLEVSEKSVTNEKSKKGGKKDKDEDVTDNEEESEDEEVTENEEDEESEETVENYLAKAPRGIREVLETTLKTNASEKDGLIKSILSVKGCEFTKNELKSFDLPTLKRIAKLSQNEKGEDKGHFLPGSNAPAPTGNSESVTPLGSPKWDFESKK